MGLMIVVAAAAPLDCVLINAVVSAFGATGDADREWLYVAFWPGASDLHVRSHVGDERESGRVVLKMSFVEVDPQETFSVGSSFAAPLSAFTFPCQSANDFLADKNGADLFGRSEAQSVAFQLEKSHLIQPGEELVAGHGGAPDIRRPWPGQVSRCGTSARRSS